MKQAKVVPGAWEKSQTRLRGWTEICGNPHCQTGWLQLWRGRSAPRFEGRWTCSAVCLEAMIADAIRSQIESWEVGGERRELRMPLGLVLLSRGWITRQELQDALAAQRRHGQGQIGEWLQRLSGVSQASICKGLAAQWNCAAFPSTTLGLAPVRGIVPNCLLRRYGLVLLRRDGSNTLYLAARSRAEHATARALEHMLGSSIQPAFLEDEVWQQFSQELTDSCEIVSPEREGAAVRICGRLEQERPRDARLVRVHDHLWLRMLNSRIHRSTQVCDIILPLRREIDIVRAS